MAEAEGPPEVVAASRLELSGHADVIMEEIKALQWSEAFSDLAVYVSRNSSMQSKLSS